MSTMDAVGLQHREGLKKAWEDFYKFTNIKPRKRNFDLFACGYLSGIADAERKAAYIDGL